MKKSLGSFCFNLRNLKIDLVIFSFIFVAPILFSGCQSSKTRLHQDLDEAARIKHAKSLLRSADKYKKISQLEHEPRLKYFIQQYVESVNKKSIDSFELTDAILAEAKAHKYDPVFLLAMIKTESQFNPRAVGTSGEVGLMQIKPETAQWICEKKGLHWMGKSSLKDPQYNVKLGAQYLAYLEKTLKEKELKDSLLYVNAYNLGISSLLRRPASEQKNHNYFARVMDNYSEIYRDLSIQQKRAY